MKVIVVIDGQGGRMGSQFIDRFKKQCKIDVELIAVGTNSIATSAMLKAGADNAATGENPVIVNSARADFIVGPIGILAADALYGEITDKMAAAVAKSSAPKLLLPVNTCCIYVAGVRETTMNELIDDVINRIIEQI